MNLQEFAALKVGDQVENPMNGSHGVVTAVFKDGVRVRWSVTAGPVDFGYSVQGTAWFHWSKVEPEPKDAHFHDDDKDLQQ